MRKLHKSLLIISSIVFGLCLLGLQAANAATSPSLGAAATYGVLGSTYTNTGAGTTVNGDVGFTTGPAVVPAGTHTNYGSGAPYATAGTVQNSALSALGLEPCTFTFANGAVDLAADTTHGAIGVYTPGVYCTGAASAASIGAGGITLSGAGTYIFRINGALTTVANSVVTLANGASSCDVFWTPTAATTLGANSTFVGTDIDAAGITIGANTTWTGRALAFGGTVTTDTDTINTPSCSSIPAPTPTPVPTPTATSTPIVPPTVTPVVPTSTPTLIVDVSPIVTPIVEAAPTLPTIVPALPNAGINSNENSRTTWYVIVLIGVFSALYSLYVTRKKV